MSSKPMTEAVLKAGLLTPSLMAEFRKFGGIDREATLEEPKDLDTAATIIALALESEGYVMVRETDLEVLHQYAETSRRGSLHLVTDNGPEEVSTNIEVTFGKTKLGEYILAWRGESIEDLILDGRAYLMFDDQQVHFNRVRELFYGETKAFMVCAPTPGAIT